MRFSPRPKCDSAPGPSVIQPWTQMLSRSGLGPNGIWLQAQMRFSPGPKCDSVPGPNAIRPWAQIPSGLGSSSQTQLCKKSYCTYRRESPLGISLLFLASVYPMMLSRHILVLILCLYELKCAHTIIHPQTPRHRHTHTHTHTHTYTHTHTHIPTHPHINT